jgi:hypothetical protein
MSCDDTTTLDDILMTPQELAARHRTTVESLANLRSRGEGLPFVKLPSGAVRYVARVVLAAEAAGLYGLTWHRIERAVSSAPGLDDRQRVRLVEHLRKQLDGQS